MTRTYIRRSYFFPSNKWRLFIGKSFIFKNINMSRIDIENKHDIIVCYNYLLFFEFLYNYLKDYKKDLNFLFYDLNYTYSYILKFKDLNASNYTSTTIDFYKEIINDHISNHFRIFIDFSKFIWNLELIDEINIYLFYFPFNKCWKVKNLILRLEN